MSLIDEDTTWIALDGADYNKAISTTGTAADATITRPANVGTGAVRVWGTTPFYFTVTQGTDETTATANSSAMPAWHVEYYPVKGSSVSVSTLRISTSGTVYVSLVKAV